MLEELNHSSSFCGKRNWFLFQVTEPLSELRSWSRWQKRWGSAIICQTYLMSSFCPHDFPHCLPCTLQGISLILAASTRHMLMPFLWPEHQYLLSSRIPLTSPFTCTGTYWSRTHSTSLVKSSHLPDIPFLQTASPNQPLQVLFNAIKISFVPIYGQITLLLAMCINNRYE